MSEKYCKEESSMPISVILADDHVMVREGLKYLLEINGEIKVIGQANDGIECLQLLEMMSPDVLLLDINMPNMNGMDVLRKIKVLPRKQKVLIVTSHSEIEYLIEAAEIGMNGYVLKDSEPEVLTTAIFTIYNGENYIQPSMKLLLDKAIEKNNKKEKAGNHMVLTKRELDVLKLLTEGLYNKEIADRLEISEKTVKNHVSRLLKKINVSDRTQAAVYAIKNNIVDLI